MPEDVGGSGLEMLDRLTIFRRKMSEDLRVINSKLYISYLVTKHVAKLVINELLGVRGIMNQMRYLVN